MIYSDTDAAGVVVIRPGVDRLTAANAKAFKDEVIALITEGASQIVIDFKEVSFLDSSGLGALTGILKRIGHRGDLVVCGLNDDIEQMFKICRMDRVFRSYRDTDAATQAMSENQ
jgi:anti-sigma B factor antagonist